MSEREVLIPERVSASFGHGRSHLDHDGSATAKILCSATLCDSGCLPPPLAALEKRPAASTCIPKPKASLSACLTACGRWVPSLDNASWRRGGQRAFLLHTPALPKSRSGHRCIGDRLLVDLGRSVDTEALQPVVHCTRCRQRFQSRSAQAHGLPRPGGLADGRVGRHGAFVSGHVAICA